jgi:hypothetical protein
LHVLELNSSLDLKTKKPMNTRIIKRLASLCVLSVLLGTGFVRLASGQQSCCLTLPAPPKNPIGVDLTAFQSPDHFFDIQVLSAPAAISPGLYNGWCLEERVDITVSLTTVPFPYSGQVFSSCDPNINTYLANEPTAVNGNWQAVNYILNHRAGYSYSDVQAAIWYFVGSGQPPNPTPYPSGPSGVPYPFVPNQDNVNLLVLDASLHTADWVAAGHPTCGDKTAAVLLFDGLPNPPGTPDIQLLLIEVPCPCVTANCVAINNAVQNVAITPVTMVGSGGCGGPYTFSATGLPAGVTMSSSGTISGTPTVSGTFNYTVTVKDSCGNTGTANCSVTVNPPPTANCVAINNAVQNVAITPVTMVGSGGCGGPYTFSATGLPAGVTMSSSGTISGTPTVSGTFPYTVTITDKCGNKGTVNCSVTVCGSSICGTVYADCDGSGNLSGGDVGYKGVVVTLKNAQGQVVATVTTDANGNYCFYNLPAGSYTVSIVQPSNCKQTAGTTTHHWKDNYGKICWKDNDNYTHWKDSNNTDCWNAKDGYMHWKDSYGRDCWKDRYGNNHWQNCNYVSCDARVDNTEPVTLGQCEAKGDVDFAYMGTAPKTQVCITGPTRAKCGDTITYTCKVSNLGNVCFTGGCKVQVCGQWFTCPNLSPGQDWTCKKDYKVQWGDFGTLNCHVTATCYPAGGGNVSNDSTCSTQVGWQ